MVFAQSGGESGVETVFAIAPHASLNPQFILANWRMVFNGNFNR
jgi:hypothetical protein